MKLANMTSSRRRAWDSVVSAHRGKPATAVERAKDYLKEDPESGFVWGILGYSLGKMARYDEAVAALRKAIRLTPSSRLGWPYAYMGHLYREKGNLRAAERWYRKALGVNSKTTINLIFLGGVLTRQGRFAEAKRYFRRAIKLGIEDTDEAHFYLGLVLLAEGHYEDALGHFDKAIELDPKYTAAKRARSDALQAIKARAKRKRVK